MLIASRHEPKIKQTHILTDSTDRVDVDSNCLAGLLKLETIHPAIIFKLNSNKKKKREDKQSTEPTQTQHPFSIFFRIWKINKWSLVWAAVIYHVFQSAKLRRHGNDTHDKLSIAVFCIGRETKSRQWSQQHREVLRLNWWTTKKLYELDVRIFCVPFLFDVNSLWSNRMRRLNGKSTSNTNRISMRK